MMKKAAFSTIVLIATVVTMSGCSTIKRVGSAPVKAVEAIHEKWAGQPEVRASDRRLERAQPVEPAPTAPNLNSYASLVSDHRAANVGENVTVFVVERASSVTTADRRTRSTLDADARFDKTTRFEEAGVAFDGSSVGAGSISREGELIASVSAVVTETLPNGDLLIFGEQTIEVNDETQYIRVAGRVRPQDIGTDNTVLSTRLSDAQIMYKGYGILAETQEPGFLTRLFNWVF